jgi:DNA polymerase III epsilon subunit-like protein
MSALVFLDTETTGLSIEDDIWEFAAIRREPDGEQTELHLFLQHDPTRCAQLPASFRADHVSRWPGLGGYVLREQAAEQIAEFLHDRPHIVGAVPNFDTERLSLLLRRHGIAKDPWHYHLIDVEALAVGYLHGQWAQRAFIGDTAPLTLPWDSDDLSRRCGVDPPTTERHTAMGDVRWAMALYDAITGGT